MDECISELTSKSLEKISKEEKNGSRLGSFKISRCSGILYEVGQNI